jgi:hypothetical protein
MIIYCIEDINDLKYVGKTNRSLHDRRRRHISDKYNPNAHGTSSSKLNLLNSIIYPLEECEEEDGKEREQYWINKIDCVNINKLYWNEEEVRKEYKKRTRHRINELQRERRKLKRNNLN